MIKGEGKMIEIKNKNLKAVISERGAELKSMIYGGREYIWQSCEEVWNSSSPLLFPICGGLKNDKYTYKGKEYTLKKHGFGKKVTFEVEYADGEKVVFLHKSNEETRKCYPFDYELRVTYTLEEKSLLTEYSVYNTTDGEMYFSIGAHEGYYTPEGIEDYDVIFPEKETLSSYVLYGNILSNQRLPILKDSSTLPLYDKYFTIDALVFKDLKSKSAILRNRKTGTGVRVDFDFAPYFLLWHKPNAPYICLEPWAGLPDTVDSEYDITKKEGIIALGAGETYTAQHRITIL